MAKYCKNQAMCEALFGIFAIVWIISRLGIYPFWSVLIHFYLNIQNYLLCKFLSVNILKENNLKIDVPFMSGFLTLDITKKNLLQFIELMDNSEISNTFDFHLLLVHSIMGKMV